tara:strand:- start:87 stop:1217 length:1131 start_codon:yes stop_codon:yes gene_type:complete
MANLPISLLPQSTTLQGDELLVNVQGGVTKKQSVQQILNANLPVTSSGITLSGDIVPLTPQGATLGTVDKPFREIFLQSGSISIESDTPGDPSAIISNVSGNLEISVGGMLLTEPQASFIAPTGSFSYLSGSFNHIGAANRFGDTVTTGSLRVSGSTIMIGDNTMEGNTSLSGSFDIIGNSTHTGSVDISGSLTASLQENYVWLGDSNNRSTEVSLDTLAASGSLIKKSYGSFFDTTSQTASLADTIYAVNHNTTDLSNGVSIVSGSRITLSETGTYTIISTHQYVHSTGGTVTITGWLRKNGNDVSYSGTDLRLKGNGDKDLYAINYFVEAEAGDYYELMWSADGTDTYIVATPARTGPVRPAVPSVITTVNKVG